MLNDRMLGSTNAQWSQIECGIAYTAALTKKGEVFTWGFNFVGQLGHGDKEHRDVPTKVAALEGLVITQVSCGRDHTAVLTDTGDLFMW